MRTAALVLQKGFTLAHVFESKLADVKHFRRLIFVGIGTVIPTIDLCTTNVNLVNIFDLGDFVMLPLEFL